MRTGNWTVQLTIHAEVDAAATFTNMPAADTFLFNSHRHVMLVDVSGMTYVRLKVNKQGTAGAAGSKLALKYNPNFSTNVATYKDIGTSEVSVAIDATNTMLDSGWIELDPSAVGNEDVCIAVVGSGGDGVIDPQFGNISVSFA